VAFVMVAVRLRGIPLHTEHPSSDPIAVRMVCAVLVAAGGVAIGLADVLPVPAWIAIVVALAVIVIALRPLLPRGTLRARRGLPSVVLMRGFIAGALFGAEIYVPYLLIERDDFPPTLAGLGLTAAAITWAVASDLSGRFGDRLGNTRIALIGVAQLAFAAAVVAVTAVGHLSPIVAIVGWAFAGGGMGLMYPRLTVLTLAYSTPQNQGFNSSALSIFDAIGSTVSIAVMGLVFTALADTDAAFPTVFAIAVALALISLIPGLRLGHGHEVGRGGDRGALSGSTH
jgi:predicted MFS family arabinose efflux permease